MLSVLRPANGLSARDRQRRAAQSIAAPRPPVWLVLPALIAVGFLIIPLVGLLLRAPWGEFTTLIAEPSVRQALWLSVWTSTVATGIAVILGVPLAWLLARNDFRGRALVRSLVLVPLVLPPVVGGVALLLAFGRTGFVGALLNDWFGLTIPFSPLAVIMAQTFVSMPFLIITVEGGLRIADRRYEEAAATLGANPLTVFRRVTLPLIASSVLAGSLLCWARALGEFGATITFAGSFPGKTQTMPIEIYFALESEPAAAIVLSLTMLAICVLVLFLLRNRWLRSESWQRSGAAS